MMTVTCYGVYCVHFLLALLLTGHTGAQNNVITYGQDFQVTDVLNGVKTGQCPIPILCRTRGSPDCGVEDAARNVLVNCTYRSAGPYMPPFPYYIISRRTFTIDMSHNELQKIDEYAFKTYNLVPINLTALDLSHNYIDFIAAQTFVGNISKDLVRLNLSHNSLKSFEAGTFDEMPSLTTLDVSHNRLVNIDPLCNTPFRLLASLDLQHNLISKFEDQCLQYASSPVSLNLNNNLLGSMDSCHFGPRVTVEYDNNPLICGCYSNTPLFSCFKLDQQSNTTTLSTSPRCSSIGTCLRWNFTVSYQPVLTALNREYDITVKMPAARSYRVEVFEYSGGSMQDVDQLTTTLLQFNSSVVSSFTSSHSLHMQSNYTVCLGVGNQRRCEFLFPPYFYAPNSASGSSLSAAVAALFILLSALLY